MILWKRQRKLGVGKLLNGYQGLWRWRRDWLYKESQGKFRGVIKTFHILMWCEFINWSELMKLYILEAFTMAYMCTYHNFKVNCIYFINYWFYKCLFNNKYLILFSLIKERKMGHFFLQKILLLTKIIQVTQ